MSNILVSVYCLAYNHEKYIKQTLEGFVNQKTNFEFEVFVHDDASKDGTAEIIKEYAEKYPNIIVPILQKENQYSKGVSISTNIIFPKMKGKYIAVCEGDDYWCDNNKLQIQVDFMENNPGYVACVHNSKIYDCIKNKTSIMYNIKKDYDICFKDVIQCGAACYQTSSLLYKKEFMQNRPSFFDEIAPVGDWPLSIYLSLNGKIRFINKIMSVYRIYSAGSWTLKNTEDLKKHNVKVNRMLKSVDEYTNYQYKDIIKNVILQHEYFLYENTNNYNK